jgi:hypothetical protein
MSVDRTQVAAALPGYEIGDELGRGGWGVVLAARHRQLRRDVAVKQLPTAFAANPDVRSRFVAEARLLASLDHPHIVPIYDFVERDGLCLLVMEKLSGGTAWERFVERGLDAPSACAIGLVTAVALEHAHGRGILHRDIKPENLLLSSDGSLLKVADFGIAKVLSGGQTMATSAGDVLGTPAYMAPEQATGGAVTPATDVYALGMTLYEMLTGRLPFPEGGSALAVLYQRVHEQPIPISEVAPDLDPGLGEAVMWAISTEPEDRPATAHAFALTLAERATKAFGRGWIDRTGLRTSLGGRIAAICERELQAPATAVPAAPVRPARRTTVLDRAPVADPQTLLPVAEARDEEREDRLRELRLLLSRAGSADAQRLAMEVERAEATAQELRELGLLRRIRSGEPPLPDGDRTEVERLAGGAGHSPAVRLGLPPDAPLAEVRAAAQQAVDRWRRRSEHPLSTRQVAGLAAQVVQVCEAMLADLASSGASGRSPGS